MYEIKNEVVPEVEEKIGEVEVYSDVEGEEDWSKVFSNKYPPGTNIFKIKDTSEDHAIAIEFGDEFIRAEIRNTHK